MGCRCSVSAGGVSWLVYEGACAGWPGTVLLCCASHRAGRPLAQPRRKETWQTLSH